MRYRPLVPLALIAVSVAGCGGGPSDEDRTNDLRAAMQAHYGDDGHYNGLGTVRVEGDAAIIDTTNHWDDPAYGAYLYCSWVENWVRRDIDDADMDIVVVMDGREVLRVDGEPATCAGAQPHV